MANFAQLDPNNNVISIVQVDNNDILDENGNESELIGIIICQAMYGNHTNWKQTSYNNNMRVRYAVVGGSYNPELNAFIPPQPYKSWWQIDEESADWVSPLGPAPELTQEQIDSGVYYRWDEDVYNEDVIINEENATQGWILETP